jgi:hypothetical protein
MTVWALLEECTGQLDEPFRRSEIVGWFRRHHPKVNEATLGAHIQAATENAANRAANNPLGARPALLRRTEHGLYMRADPTRDRAGTAAQEPQRGSGGSGADIILIGCVRTKLPTPSPAAELFRSPLFAGRRRYATGSGRPWYILSAKYGLLHPTDVIGPYDVYLAEQSSRYRSAWGDFVIARLEQCHQDLRGLTVEVHAGAAYVEPLRGPLADRRAALTTPAAHLRQGEQLAWYNSIPPHLPADPRPRHPETAAEGASHLARVLSEPARALSPQELLSHGPDGLRCPGLYSWWVDEAGATDLSRGLGQLVRAGLIYAGQAGATRWPSGKQSRGTLWDRITDMHLAGSAEFSTFRRTLAAILGPVLDMSGKDESRLSAWMAAHLRVITAPVTDPDHLGTIEAAVLKSLDPPLNLQGRSPSQLRARLTELRRHSGLLDRAPTT